MKERIKIMKEKQARQKAKMSLGHGKQLMALYNTCDHTFCDWFHYDSRGNVSVYIRRICNICGYVENKLDNE
jgi:hypothetical protein